ncbi:MAG: hypothetical protein M3R72_03820 [Bacteroidota bacterium]|nr:hypothetical protein [Bacteroidota bacterium]
MSFLKASFLLCFLFSCLFIHAQLFQRHGNISLHKLIATNEKKTRRYVNADVLKMRYYHNGEIIKAKGRLLIDSMSVVEIIPYRRKPIVFIPTDSIFSISRWHRKDKIVLAIAAGAGIVAGVLPVISLSKTAVGAGESNAYLPILFLIPVVLDGYFIIIAAPIVFISEWSSLRSQKRGYHFYIQ